jgi:hypothetical protein
MALFGGRKREQRLKEAGVDAQAELVSFQEIGQQNFTPLVELTLRITPADGSGSFEVATRGQVEFSVIGKLQPGDAITVRYDPGDNGNFEVIGDWDLRSAGASGGNGSLEADSAGDIAAAVKRRGRRGNANRPPSCWRAASE